MLPCGERAELPVAVSGVELAQACAAAWSTATRTSGVTPEPDAATSCCCVVAMFHANARMTPTATGPIEERSPLTPRRPRSGRALVPPRLGMLLRTDRERTRTGGTRGRGSPATSLPSQKGNMTYGNRLTTLYRPGSADPAQRSASARTVATRSCWPGVISGKSGRDSSSSALRSVTGKVPFAYSMRSANAGIRWMGAG